MGISVVLAAMPAASTTAILAAKYGGDEVFATKCVVFTTLLSMVSAPVWGMVLQRYYIMSSYFYKGGFACIV